jgi:hypothetical protein
MKKETPFQLISFYRPLLIAIFFASALGAGAQITPKAHAAIGDTTKTCPPCPGLCPACQSINTKLKIDYQLATMSFKQPKDIHDWITMDITFKPNTDEEFREKAVRAIEKMWIKDAALSKKNSANLYPNISVTKFPFSDTLKYRLSLFR